MTPTRVICASASCSEYAISSTMNRRQLIDRLVRDGGWRVTSSEDEELEALCPRCQH